MMKKTSMDNSYASGSSRKGQIQPAVLIPSGHRKLNGHSASFLEKRRRFLKNGAFAGVLLLAGGGLGAGFVASNGVTSSGKSATELAFADVYKELDRLFLSDGNRALAGILETSEERDVTLMFDWIEAERVLSAYPVLLSGLEDPRREIRRDAAGRLRRIPPAQLTTYSARIRGAVSTERDSVIRTMLEGLAAGVAEV